MRQNSVPGDQLQSETRYCHHNPLIIDQLHHQEMDMEAVMMVM